MERPPKKYSAAAIMKSYCHLTLMKRELPTNVLFKFGIAAYFVTDLTKLAHPVNIKRDAYGHWVQNISHTNVFECSSDEDGDVSINKPAPGASGFNMCYLQQIHCMHPSNSSF